MHFKVHFLFLLLGVILMQKIFGCWSLPCDSCGKECTSACGTKHFRTCCFNYLRKRTDPKAMKIISNKRLIDFMMLQGRALLTQNELSNYARVPQQQHKQQNAASHILNVVGVEELVASMPCNGSSFNIDVDLKAYYDD